MRLSPAQPTAELVPQPPKFRRVTHVDRVEVSLPGEKDPTLGAVSIALISLGAAALLLGMSGGYSAIVPVLSIVAIVAGIAIHLWRNHAAKTPFQVVVFRAGGVSVDAASLSWDELGEMRRAHDRSGGSLVLHGHSGQILRIGGNLRPSGVDWIEQEVVAHYDTAMNAGGTRDDDALADLASVRGRE